MTRSKIGVIFAIGLSGLLAACSPTLESGLEGIEVPGPSSRPMTVDNVEGGDRLTRLAAEQHPRIVQDHGGEYNDPKLERMLARVVGQLTTASSDVGQIYRITILDSPAINAFALPGGYLYITRGLIALANDSAELATVIAHEMAHVTANHGLARQRKEREETVVAQVAEEVLPGNSSARVAAIRGQLRLAQFSRNQELEADAIGIRATAESGFDPYAAARFLRSMTAYTAFRNVSGRDNRFDFLATHPASERRMVIAKQLAQAQGGPGIGERERDFYLDGIDGMIFGDSAEQGFIRDNRFLHPGLGITFSVPRDFVLDNSTDAVTATGPDEAAIRFDSVDIEDGQSLADYLRGDVIAGLDRQSIKTTQRDGMDVATASAYADGWQFGVGVFRIDGQEYRILSAAPAGSSDLAAITRQTTDSFRRLSAEERSSIRPLRMRVVTVGAGDTVASLAARMQGTDRKTELFRLLNGLSSSDRLQPGDRVKLVLDR